MSYPIPDAHFFAYPGVLKTSVSNAFRLSVMVSWKNRPKNKNGSAVFAKAYKNGSAVSAFKLALPGDAQPPGNVANYKRR